MDDGEAPLVFGCIISQKPASSITIGQSNNRQCTSVESNYGKYQKEELMNR